MKTFVVNTDLGMTIKRAKDANNACRKVQIEIGTLNSIRNVKEATKEDVSWYLAMGGNEDNVK